VEDGTINIRTHSPYALEHAQKAHQDLQARRTTGSVVLKI